MRNARSPAALCPACGTFEPDARVCEICRMASRGDAHDCVNRARGCRGTRDDMWAVLTDTLLPGSPAYVEGQRILASRRGRAQRPHGGRVDFDRWLDRGHDGGAK